MLFGIKAIREIYNIIAVFMRSAWRNRCKEHFFAIILIIFRFWRIQYEEFLFRYIPIARITEIKYFGGGIRWASPSTEA